MKFLVNIEEVISQNFEVEAATVEEALEIAIENYDNKEFILEDSELLSTSVEVFDEITGCWSEKVEI